MTQYAQPSDLLTRFDARLIGNLVSDNATSVEPTDLLTNTVLLAIMADASAAIDSAVRVGNRYTPAQMAGLEAAAAQLVMRLCCDMTLMYLKRRRGKVADADKELIDEIDRRLKSLKTGDDYLMLAGASEAAASTIELAGPCLIAVGPPGPLVTIRQTTPNYYPERRGPWNNGYGGNYY